MKVVLDAMKVALVVWMDVMQVVLDVVVKMLEAETDVLKGAFEKVEEG
jgi:hypothetical protein